MNTQMVIRDMNPKDLDQVFKIEKSSFSSPWKKESFHHELFHNMYAHYLVLEVDEQVVGYCGIWIVMDDAQITNIAVSPAYRGRSFGEALLKAAMKLCRMKRAVQLSLEVRVSNHIAQSLYKKLGFEPGGIRKNYYTDNGEDALLMWVRLNES
ncbi:ribosomal protein S18-alanine N-acetyltransferase [Bacillus haynesii]|uniref:ribosomal protein S18-alanine N-acetyltransferase n=1 Tax=Bacillus haynesii TaxID=1925021 RepID=UPI00227FAF98|nr:ribosomal protein S18-alanine N-acetyltransferase [Bacillus haynesii]MCY7913689.1 ribosomal protein S18-alanine N-acetyltransferase [Bacillus haynesii]MCY7928251.1 ribosomal protein S18-alanine N-acetyltransferase [Bacillus haynesii]MCY8010806.1 ribosomal protein S18-alanine N-acetyltransferase [Bacillus haynesii]MCY8771772.1 ribosomal protein S18-alanine N-acetyltransferase [Bacillus haynesii]MCY9373507.1 ribosomal protein S18-alanine N-acetyltransferase [Bacillus haynesii]